MNMQALMQQAKKIQKDMLEAKEQINKTIYEGTSSFVTVKVNGNKELQEIKIDKEVVESDEMELVQDMLIVAINEAMKKIDKDTEEKMGKYTKGMPGLF